MSELPKTYDPKSVEDKLYKFWVDSGFFHAEVNPDKKPYTIVIPPPNVTGQLHMGHAFDETLHDILIRTSRRAYGRGRTSSATASSASSRSSAPPATGTASASPWTRAAPRLSARFL